MFSINKAFCFNLDKLGVFNKLYMPPDIYVSVLALCRIGVKPFDVLLQREVNCRIEV